ncbi:MAG: ABC transporter permease [Alphaproteobacteria bacterium]|mgnify:FL=1|jgi:lipoprotein-releasing system permease protein|nr:ABC transporter permease [Alphaproteobacteria bacterium]PPR57461.1 MAG: Lipoprotein-releasing system transmembrane protein LolE [Alphaproteobacteria bacterium MarineAlpha5_Bin3]
MLFSSYEILLIKRFLFSKKTDGFISIFSWFSIIGIAIGVAAIIIVMAVMNGFREELISRLLGINGHLNIYSNSGQITKEEVNIIKSDFSDNQLIPLIQTQALVISNEFSKGVFLRGYDNEYLDDLHFLKKNIVEGKLFGNNINDIVIGYVLANKFGLSVGDEIKIAIPKTDNTIFGNIPRFKTLTVSGILNLGMYEYDSSFVFSNISIARKLLVLEDQNFNLIEIFTQSPNNIEIIQDKVNRRIIANNFRLYTSSWKENNSTLINALNVEKNVMFLILTLIILVASMNIISGLIIFVKEKNKDIGILKTIGLSNKSLIKIFLSIGLIIGLIGTIFGGLVGVIFSLNIKSIQFFIENILHTDLFAKEIYYLSNLPSRVDNLEVFYVLIISIIICLIATTIPAYRSMKVDPIKSLKND